MKKLTSLLLIIILVALVPSAALAFNSESGKEINIDQSQVIGEGSLSEAKKELMDIVSQNEARGYITITPEEFMKVMANTRSGYFYYQTLSDGVRYNNVKFAEAYYSFYFWTPPKQFMGLDSASFAKESHVSNIAFFQSPVYQYNPSTKWFSAALPLNISSTTYGNISFIETDNFYLG